MIKLKKLTLTLLMMTGIISLAVLSYIDGEDSAQQSSGKFSVLKQTNNIGTSPDKFKSKEIFKKNPPTVSYKNLEYIPSGFHLAFTINILALKSFFWSHKLLNQLKIPSIRRKLNAINMSFNGINTLTAGLVPRKHMLRWNGKQLITELPAMVFWVNGAESRMEALKRFWMGKKNSQSKYYVQGGFQLGFPVRSNPYILVGSHMTEITPVMNLIEHIKSYHSICEKSCKQAFKYISVKPHFIIVYKPAYSRQIYGHIRLVSFISGIRFNTDGILVISLFKWKQPCHKIKDNILKVLEHVLSSVHIDSTLISRAHIHCISEYESLVSISVSSSNITTQFNLLGLM